MHTKPPSPLTLKQQFAEPTIVTEDLSEDDLPIPHHTGFTGNSLSW